MVKKTSSAKKTVKIDTKKSKKDNPPGLFVPTGIFFLGLGVGFITGYVVAGLFIGLGVGFLAMAIVMNMKKK